MIPVVDNDIAVILLLLASDTDPTLPLRYIGTIGYVVPKLYVSVADVEPKENT